MAYRFCPKRKSNPPDLAAGSAQTDAIPINRPRWLVEHGYIERARKSLTYFREGSFTPDETEAELSEIQQSVAEFRASGLNWLCLFRERPLFARLWRAALLQFMAQMCGATAMKYYLPTLFKALGLTTRLSLLAGGIESTLKIGCTILEMFIIDRVGRRLTLAVGAGVMAFAMLVSGPLSTRTVWHAGSG